MAKVGKPKIRIPAEVIAQWLEHPEVLKQLHAASEKARANVEAKVPSDVRVTVTHTVNRNGRPADILMIKHASGAARQLRDGVLTISAAEAGLEIGRR